LALLTLLNDCRLRSQEAADLQLRDVDLAGAQLTVRAGKGRKPRRVPLVGESLQRIEHYLVVRCPDGLPAIASDHERALFLMGQQANQPGQPWLPGMTTAAQRKRFSELRCSAAAKVREQAKKEANVARVGELLGLARQLDEASPHRLLESGATPAYVQAILRYSRVSTALMHGKPTEHDQRAALARRTPFAGEGDSGESMTAVGDQRVSFFVDSY
jgi:site-specific recombinase XerC